MQIVSLVVGYNRRRHKRLMLDGLLLILLRHNLNDLNRVYPIFCDDRCRNHQLTTISLVKGSR